MESIIKSIKCDIQKVLKDINTTDLVKILKYASNKYYNDIEVLSDKEYDLLYDLLKKKSPKNKFFEQIGYEVNNKNKVKLPYHMGSMDKKKPGDKTITSWLKKYKGPYTITDKLDGVSGLLSIKNNDMRLYTRGDGTYGTDISHIIPAILPNKNKLINSELNVRGEFIITKKNFEKYKKKYSNSRSMVNGIINKKNPTEKELKLVDFVIYEYISNFKLSKQLKIINKLGFIMVNAIKTDSINEKDLSKLLQNRKNNSNYDIDGLIITDDNNHNRNKSGNPDYAFAFKDISLLESADVEVVKVEWNISKDNLLKPRIEIKPVSLSGVTINYVTGFNAKYIVDNKIGKGSKLKIIRSGDVIPHIIDIIKKTEPSMPKYKYRWTDSKIDIIITEDNEDIRFEKLTKSITYFLKKLDIKNIDTKLVEKFILNKLDTIPKLLKAKSKDFLNIDGIKETMASKIYDNIQNGIKNVKLSKLMTASNIFGQGFGEKKLEVIIKEYPDIIKYSKKDEIIKIIKELNGFEEKTATKFAEGLPKFKIFLKTVPMITISKVKKSGNKLKDFKIVFSGFRDKELEEFIEDNGGKVVNSVSKNINFIIVKDINESSSKITKAKELNVKIISKNSFIKNYK